MGLMLDESRFGLNFRKAIPVVRKLLPFQTVHCMWQLLAWYAARSPLTSHWGGWPPLSTAYSSVLILVIFHFGNPHIWCGRHRQCLWKKFFPVEKFQIYFSLTIVHFGGFLAVQTRVWLLNRWPCHWLTDSLTHFFKNTMTEWPKRLVTFQTFDEWQEGMTSPKKRQWQRQIQRQRQWQRQIFTFETFDQSDEETWYDQKKTMTKTNTKTIIWVHLMCEVKFYLTLKNHYFGLFW